MKTTFCTLLVIISSFIFAQQDFKKSELHDRVKNSILYKEENLDEETIKGIVSEYICLNKYYKIKFNEQSTFLNEEEFKKKYKKEIDNSENLIFLAGQKSFMYNLMMSNYDQRIRVQKSYKKCIPKSSVNW